MEYTTGQIRQFIREVVRETKRTVKIETHFLQRSIKGDLVKGGKVEFRQVFYGAYNNNSQLIRNAEKIMPKDIPWKVIFVDESGRETVVKGETRLGRSISRKSVSSGNISTDRIKSFIALLKPNAKKKVSKTETGGSIDEEES